MNRLIHTLRARPPLLKKFSSVAEQNVPKVPKTEITISDGSSNSSADNFGRGVPGSSAVPSSSTGPTLEARIKSLELRFEELGDKIRRLSKNLVHSTFSNGGL